MNNPEEYFRVHDNICFMVFPNKFNILIDVSGDQNYPLHAKTIRFYLTFVLVIVNPRCQSN